MKKQILLLSFSIFVASWINIALANSVYQIKLSDDTSYQVLTISTGNWTVKNQNNEIVGSIQRNNESNNFIVKNKNGLNLGSTATINPDALNLINNQ